VPDHRAPKRIWGIGARSQGKGGAARSALEMREDAAPGPLTQASAAQPPGRLGHKGARTIGGRAL